MNFKRLALAILVGIATAGVGSGAAVAVTPADPSDGASGLVDDVDGGSDAEAQAVPAALPPPSVALSGGLACSIQSIAEASTRWRYGRARNDASINETTSHVRVSGSASGCAGLKADFSVVLLLPSLRIGAYGSGPDAWASVWGRTDRSSTVPDIEWDTRVRAAPSRLALTITHLAEISRTSERGREGAVSVETTLFSVHGTITATLPCARAAADRRASCRTETLVGSF
jgi:hypothetical protein